MKDQDIPADWQALMAEYEQRMEQGHAMGGPKKLATRAVKNKLNAREVIRDFVDPDSFMELGSLVGGIKYQDSQDSPCDGIVGGTASVNGRPIVVAVEDFTVLGGSIGHGAAAKRVRYARLAAQEKIPYILFLDGAGYRASNALERHPYTSSDLQELARLSGLVPTVAVVLGASAGHGALTGLMMDFLVMLEDAVMFSAGPPLVAAALGEEVSKQQLGGATMHAAVSGVCHNLAADAPAAFKLVKQYLTYMPVNAWQRSQILEDEHSKERSLDSIFEIVPRNGQLPYDMRRLIVQIVDRRNTWLEIQPLYGTSLLTGFAHIGGFPVGIVANQPNVIAGAINTEAALKATHFIDLCNAFHLPVVFLADNPGILPGTQAERSGALRAAARMYAAQAQLSTPKIHVTLRKAFGFGSSIMAMNPFDQQTLTLALPGITLGGIPAIGGAEASGADSATSTQLQEAEASGSWTAGDTMAYDEIIDPRQLRNAIIRGLVNSSERPAPAGPYRGSGIRP